MTTSTINRPVKALHEALHEIIPTLVGWTATRGTSGAWMVATPRGAVRTAPERDWNEENATRALNRLRVKGLDTAKRKRDGAVAARDEQPETPKPTRTSSTQRPKPTVSTPPDDVAVQRRGAEVPGYDGDALPEEGDVSRVIELTPELARHFVARPWEAVTSDGRSLRQRPLEEPQVEMFSTLIFRDKFRLTYQGLGIGSNGSFYDGQHRAHAVIRTGKTVRVRVHYNVSPDDIMALDSGRQRRASTKLGMEGFKNPLQLGSAARALSQYLDYELAHTLKDTEGELVKNWRQWHDTRISDIDVDDIVHAHPGLEDAVDWAARNKHKRINQSAVGLFRYLTLRTCGNEVEEKLDAFLNAVIHGLGIDALDHPAVAMRNWIERDQAHNRRNAREAHLFALIKTWNFWSAGRALKRLPDDLGPIFPLIQKPKKPRKPRS